MRRRTAAPLAMREINLQEYQQSESLQLSVNERDALRDVLPSVAVHPVAGIEGTYFLTPGSTVGAVEIGGLSVLIKPKIGILMLLSLACYAIGRVKFQAEDFTFPGGYALSDALALALASHARQAFSNGLLHGYRTEEEALQTVRGRVRFDEQLRRRFDLPLPVEVQYDEFIPERFLPRPDGSMSPVLTGPAYIPFGPGHRRRPGRRFAETTVWLHITRMLHRLRFETPEGCRCPRTKCSAWRFRPSRTRCGRNGGGRGGNYSDF